MSEIDEPADQELEEIVAYLDGELSSEQCARVERRLASDEDYRQALQSVERAWGALDELPMETVDDRFARTTMSMVIDAATAEIQDRTRALPVQRRRRWLSSALATATAACLGFLAFRLAWHDPNATLLADLPVIENIDIYSQFADIKFLRELQPTVGELEQLNGDERDLQQRAARFDVIAQSNDAAAWVGKLDEDQKSSLRSKFNRFRELPEEEKTRLRELHQAVTSAEDSASLVHTMLAYQQWLGGLPPVGQFELRDIDDPAQRVATIRRWSEMMRTNEALTLSDDELIAFFTQLREPVYAMRARTRHNNRGNDRDRLKDMASGKSASEWRFQLLEQFDNYREGRPAPFYRAVLNALPERAKEAFASLPPDQRVNRFITWVRQHTACRGEVSKAELEGFFEKELDLKVQAQLLSMPADEMQQALLRMYRCEPKSQPVTGWWPQFGPGSFGPPPGPPPGVGFGGGPRGANEHDDRGGRGAPDRGGRERRDLGERPQRPPFDDGPPPGPGGPPGPPPRD